MGEVAEAVGLSRPGVTSTVNRLVADGPGPARARRRRPAAAARAPHRRPAGSGSRAAARTHDELVAHLLHPARGRRGRGHRRPRRGSRPPPATRALTPPSGPRSTARTLQARSVFGGTGSGTGRPCRGCWRVHASSCRPSAGRRWTRCSTHWPPRRRPAPGRADPGRRPARRRPAAPSTAPACRRSASSAPAAVARPRARNLGWRTAPHRVDRLPRRRRRPRPRLVRAAGRGPRRPAGRRRRAARAGCGCRCPTDRRPTDWERGTAGLATSSWITADLAYRRAALAAVGGFDERFPRAFREDSDLALRVMDTGGAAGPRASAGSPTRCARPTAGSAVRVQAGNADDVLMRRLHGPTWRERADAALGRRPQHLASPPPRSRPSASPSPGGRGRAALAAAGVGRRHRRVRLGPHRARAARPATRSPPWSLTSARSRRWRPGTACAALVQHRRVRPLARACPTWCSSTATAPSCTTSPTTATPSGCGRSTARRRRWTGCAPAACGSAWSATSPASPAGLITRDQVDACNAPAGRAARPVRHRPGLPARARRRLRLPQARARAWSRPPAPSSTSTRPAAWSSATSAPTSTPRPRPARSGSWSRRRSPAAQEVEAADRTARPTLTAGGRRRPGGLPGEPRRCSSPGWTTPATSCCRARWCARWPPAPTGSSFLAGPAGAEAAALLPGVDEVWTWRCPWILGDPPPVDAADVAALTERRPRARARRGADLAPRSTSRRCRWRWCCGTAGVPRISAISVDYPGSLLDVRHRVDDDLPEPERALSLARAAGFDLPPGDDGRLAVRRPLPPVAHEPGLRRPASGRLGAGPGLAGRALRRGGRGARPTTGYRVLVTGGPGERALTAAVAGTRGVDLGGRHRPGRDGRRARRRRGGRRRQHRPGAPGRGGRHPRRLAVLPGRPGRPVGALRRAHRAARRPVRPLPGHPGARVPGARPSLPDLGDRGGRRRRRGEAGESREGPDLARARLLDDGVRPGPPRVPAARDARIAAPTVSGAPAPGTGRRRPAR